MSTDKQSSYYDVFPDIEVMDIIKAVLTPEQFEGFLLGNMIKYPLRANKKGQFERDVQKANIYSNMLLNALNLADSNDEATQEALDSLRQLNKFHEPVEQVEQVETVEPVEQVEQPQVEVEPVEPPQVETVEKPVNPNMQLGPDHPLFYYDSGFLEEYGLDSADLQKIAAHWTKPLKESEMYARIEGYIAKEIDLLPNSVFSVEEPNRKPKPKPNQRDKGIK